MTPSERRDRGNPARVGKATPVNLSEEEALPLLQSGEVIGGQRMARGSNYTFLVGIDAGPGKYLRAIYKPRDGERPLYDFPRGSLYWREYAAFLLSRIQGWPNIPLTLIREGPHGLGSMQLYVEAEPEVTYFDLVDDRERELHELAVFDLIANNADRKAGHCLLGKDGLIWSIDHGLTFHPMFKLRTVMLEFWGKPIPEALVGGLETLLGRLESVDEGTEPLAELLAQGEIDALKRRVQALIEKPALPALDPYRHVPWPWA